MAGLLDSGNWFTGDDTVKDQFGQTQADRREPLWSGLIQGGMGLLAASQDMTPAQRAQYMAQAGQAYGGIPAAMRAQTSAAAQQMLQGQQIKAGQAKLDAQTRLAALAKTPEFQAAVAKLEPEERMLLQASLDAGDMGHAQEILTGAARTRATQAETLRKEKRDDAKAAAEAAKADAANPYGKSEAGVHTYNLQHANPGSFEYWKAYDYFSKDQKAPDGTIIPKTDLKERKFAEPSGSPGNWVPANMPVVPTAPMPPAATPPTATPPAPPPAVVPPGSLPPFQIPGVGMGTPAAPPPAVPPPVPPAVTQPPPPAVPPPVPTPPVVAPGTAITPDVAAKIAQDPTFKVDETRVVNGVEFYKDKQGRVEYDTGTDRYRIDAPGKTPTQLPPLKQLDNARETGLINNHTTINKVDYALSEWARNPKALVGLAANLPPAVLQRIDPDGQALRDMLKDLTGVIIHDRSGASVTEGEKRNLDFLPKDTDTGPIIKDRLERMKRWADEQNRQAYLTNRREYKMPPSVKERYGAGAKSAAETPKVKRYNKDTGEFE